MPKVMCLSLNGQEGPHRAMLEEAGFEIGFPPESRRLADDASVIELVRGADATIAGSEPYTAKVIEACPELRVIARTGVGFDAIDLEACDRAGVVVTTTPGVNHHSVAEHTLAMLLGLARGFPGKDQEVRRGHWKRVARPRVLGTTLGVVGLGRIGRAVAWRARGLGMKVLAFEPYPNQEFVDQNEVELCSLDELFARSDYVTLHCPATPENLHLINRDSLARMKPGAVLINTARGALVDEAALVEALRSGHIRGAGLDVFETEPLPLDSPLLEVDGLMLAGHLAGLDNESHEDTFAMAAQIIIDLHAGRWPAADCVQNLRGVSDWSWNRS